MDTRLDWERFVFEARYALRRLDSTLLRAWGKQSLAAAVQATGSRAFTIFDLVRAAAQGLWHEFKVAWSALWNGELSVYLRDLAKRVWAKLRELWTTLLQRLDETKAFVTSLPQASAAQITEYAIAMLGAVLGFAFIGGCGDGGVIDADLMAFGIGGHRSMWFHSAFVGLAAEVSIRSSFELVRLLHRQLPERHLPIWDRLLKLSSIWTSSLVAGSWLGVASHLTVDSHIDGWTPYKDLPIALPNWGHHLIMDLNAAASGWFAWQWRHKVVRVLRGKPSPTSPSVNGKAMPLLA